MRRILVHPAMVLGSDGIFGPRPHPRVYGAAARVVGRYALREGLLPMEEMVAADRRTAARFGLADRGRIAKGLRADLVLLDPARYVDVATYDDPSPSRTASQRVVVGGRRRGGTARDRSPRRPGGDRAAAAARRRGSVGGVTTILPKCARASISS